LPIGEKALVEDRNVSLLDPGQLEDVNDTLRLDVFINQVAYGPIELASNALRLHCLAHLAADALETNHVVGERPAVIEVLHEQVGIRQSELGIEKSVAQRVIGREMSVGERVKVL